MPRPIDQPKRKRTDRRQPPNPGARQRQDELLDEALEETFPASDPIAPARVREPQGTARGKRTTDQHR